MSKLSLTLCTFSITMLDSFSHSSFILLVYLQSVHIKKQQGLLKHYLKQRFSSQGYSVKIQLEQQLVVKQLVDGVMQNKKSTYQHLQKLSLVQSTNTKERLVLALLYLYILDSISLSYNMSQQSSINLEQLVRQQQEQIAILQALIVQAGLEKKGTVVAVSQPSIGSNIKEAKLQMFNMEAEKILGFLMVCRLYIRIKIRNILVEKQVQ